MTVKTTGRTVDAVVIGAGFGGIYAVHKLHNELGLTTVGFDKAAGPGGTWYWNRYPGALSDTESYVYRFSFDRDLLQSGTWKNTYVTQPEILEYLEDVVDRFGLRRHFRFGTEVKSAIYLEDEALWEVTTDAGDVYRAKYVVNAVGLLSAVNLPNLPGLDTFEGDIIHTAAWPEGKDLAGHRVGVIGTGSTGQQVITALAPEVEHLTVFVRTPQYSVPVGNRPVTTQQIDAVKADYDRIWEQVKASSVAFGFEESTVPALAVSEEERPPRLRGGLAAWRRIPLHVCHLR
ncbi:flavin-containing monooxygenase [Arthrobacter sp. TB 26]|uniref:flavin-containing monooxygenase n=1 Tax=Arthrobacter sp. TB 26 TaxID=494420 RepID=UPI00192CB75D|nr:NAD(P)/FAD-dependent oxidoreductase [Arthrobacter sp. TB 26]